MNTGEDQHQSNPIIDNSGSISGEERSATRTEYQTNRPMDSQTNEDDGESKRVSKKMTPLPEDFQPGEYDVICGRGRNIWNSVGNVRFRRVVEDRVDKYSAAKTKLDKSAVLSSIVADIRNLSPDGGFVKKDLKTNKWYEVGDFLAREKVSQSFRDVLHDRYLSSNKTKKKKREEEQAHSAVISSTMQKLALEQIQTGKTDKNLYEIICQQQSLLDSSNRPSQSAMRADSTGGGVISRPDVRLSDVNATAPFPPTNTNSTFASLHSPQNELGTLTHQSIAQNQGNQMELDFLAGIQSQPYQSQLQPSFQGPQPFPNTIEAMLANSTSRQYITQMRPSSQFQYPQAQHPPNSIQRIGMNAIDEGHPPSPAPPLQYSEFARSLAAAICQSEQGGHNHEDNPFEPVPLPEGNQANEGNGQALPDDIDNIFDDS